jgi:hypothetical protein
MKYDLEERTAKFGEDIIEFAKELPKNIITIPIINQLVRAGTSSALIIVKQLEPVPKKILEIKYLSQRKNLKKLNTG